MNLHWLPTTAALAGHIDVMAVLAQSGAMHKSPEWREVWNDGVRILTRHLTTANPGQDSIYADKVKDEFEPFLALFPNVVLAHWHEPVSARLFIAIRPLPIHILGVQKETEWADGGWRSPAEFFYHDLDHARFKVREDLLALGYDCPDAYQSVNGEPASTLDPATGRHRCIVPHMQNSIEKAAKELWKLAPKRIELARRILDELDTMDGNDRPLAEASEFLLFEIVHEKSFPLDAAILRRELSLDAHIRKLQTKCATRFFGPDQPSNEGAKRFEDARRWLLSYLEPS